MLHRMSAAETPPDAKPAPKPPRSALRRTLIGLAGVVAFLASLPIAAWFLLPRLELADMAAERATTMLGRNVTIESLRVTPGRRVGIALNGVKLANIEGGTRDDMLRLEALTAGLDLWALLNGRLALHEVQVQGLSLLLERDAARVANWRFSAGGEAGDARARFPLFEAIRVTGSEILFRTSGGLLLPTRIETASLTAESLHAPIQLRAEGSYNGQDITLEGPLDSIASLRDAGTPFSLDLTAVAGETTLALIGSARNPLNFEGVQGQLELRAPNPDAIMAIAGAEGVPRVALELAGTFDRQGDVWRLGVPGGTLDGAAFTGRLLQLTEGARGAPDAVLLDLAFTRLDMNRLLGADGDEADLPLATFAAPDPLIEARLSAAEFRYGALLARDARLVAALRPGVIAVESLAMNAFGARITASGQIEPEGEELRVSADVTLADGDLDALRRAFGIREFPLAGRIEGRMLVTGQGRSMNAAARAGHVQAVLAMSGGTIAREVIEMASADLRALLRTARGRTRLSCALGVLEMRGGVGEIAPLRLRAATGTVSAMASFDLNSERLDLILASHRQTTGSFALDIPLRISGSFADPEVLPAQWSTAGRARLSAADAGLPLPPALRDLARRSPCFFAGR